MHLNRAQSACLLCDRALDLSFSLIGAYKHSVLNMSSSQKPAAGSSRPSDAGEPGSAVPSASGAEDILH